MNEDRWAQIAESGSTRALRFGGWLLHAIGRGPSRALLWLPSLYFLARNRHTRRGSRQYLAQLWSSPEGRAALGRRPGLGAVLRHIHEFAVSLYDRMLVFGGALDSMEILHDGSGKLFDLARTGRGALLLGAHVGSVDLLWLVSRKYDLRVNVAAFYGNATRINSFLESQLGEGRVRVIDLDPGSVRAAFEIKACIDRGEFVVILADRLAPGRTARTAETTFLGRTARFPLAPFLLAGVLECPVLFASCLCIGDGRYETLLRPLGDAGRVRREEREKRARELLERYVALLESTCMRLPYQWFNFFEFWGEDGEDRR
jgi:predicted LPLAT superfamily acyltransferase